MVGGFAGCLARNHATRTVPKWLLDSVSDSNSRREASRARWAARHGLQLLCLVGTSAEPRTISDSSGFFAGFFILLHQLPAGRLIGCWGARAACIRLRPSGEDALPQSTQQGLLLLAGDELDTRQLRLRLLWQRRWPRRKGRRLQALRARSCSAQLVRHLGGRRLRAVPLLLRSCANSLLLLLLFVVGMHTLVHHGRLLRRVRQAAHDDSHHRRHPLGGVGRTGAPQRGILRGAWRA